MTLVIRDVREHELDSVLALNNAVGPRILPLDSAGVRWFFTHAEYFRIAEIDGVIAGFLIALRETSSYSSPNFLWFRERYPKFLYIDRIVIAESYRRHGLGRIFYCDVTSYAELRVPLLTCEVFLEPRDDATVRRGAVSRHLWIPGSGSATHERRRPTGQPAGKNPVQP